MARVLRSSRTPDKGRMLGAPARPKLCRFAHGVAFRLDDSATESAADGTETQVPKRKWINVATEGSYAGHVDGQFTLDRKVFQQFVDGIHADPRYHAGPDGVGDAPVLPFDYEHASEIDPTSGTIPLTGAPAPAWVLDLKVQDGEDGKAELWAFAELGETIRSQIENKEYLFTSIAFTLDATDPVSGQAVGARISSIAFTNHPFIRDLTAIAASARQLLESGYVQGETLRTLSWYDAAGSPEQGMQYTRQCLGLGATADVAEVLAEISKLVSLAATPDSPDLLGVDLDDIFEGLRKIWGVPPTSTISELSAVITKAGQMLALPAASAANTTPPAPAPNAAARGLSTTEEEKMLTEKFKKIATLLLKAKRPGQTGTFTLDDEQAVEGAVEELVKNTDDLFAVLKALGAESASAALAALPELMSAKSKIASIQQQLDEALSMQAEASASSEAADVEAAMSAAGLAGDSPVVAALRVQREALITAEVQKLGEQRSPKLLADARQNGRKAFLASYKVAPEAQERLLKNLVAGPNGTQLRTPDAPAVNARTLSDDAQRGKGDKKQIVLTGLSGPNTFARLVTFVEREPGGEKLTWDEKCRRASAINRDTARYEIVDETT